MAAAASDRDAEVIVRVLRPCGGDEARGVRDLVEALVRALV